jgi:beta-glucosidase
MKKSALFIVAAAALMVGCTSTDKVAQKTLDQQEVMSKLSLEDKAHFVIGVGMEGFSGDNAVIGATKSLVHGAAGTTYPLD